MDQLMAQRFPDRFSAGQRTESSGSLPPTDVWIVAADALIGELQTRRVPLTSGGRERDWQTFSSQWTALAGQYAPVVAAVHSTAHKQVLSTVQSMTLGAQTATFLRGGVDFPAVDPTIDELDARLRSVKPGLGPLWFSLGGVLGSTELAMRVVSGDGSAKEDIRLDSAPHAMPAIIDLDVAGGFRTATALIAERVILSMLATLPPDQVTIRVFDPIKLGDSAAFLYGLGDVAERVIGDKVKTTERELDELLHETEEHITRVTQKYLQGDHATLTAYNIAAQMVTEPYRVLLLYDFPAGFQRQDQLDRDRLERLTKIIGGGSRAGVFTIIVSDKVSITEFEQVGDDWNKQFVESPHMQYINSLPCFTDSQFLDPSSFRSLVGIDSTAMTFRPHSVVHPSRARLEPLEFNAQLRANEFELRWGPIIVEEGNAIRRKHLLTKIQSAYETTSSGTVIRPGWVAGLAASDAVRRHQRGSGPSETVAQPYEPQTWWNNSAAEKAVANIGQLGATHVAKLELTSESGGVGALIGGRPGSGKSVLMHALIMSLVLDYSPAELELYLIDFKEGVEFKSYADARLPHAKAIAIEAEREFGIAVLTAVAEEIGRRGEKFKASNQTKLDDYRRATGEVIARQMVIVDEFQKLFEKDDKLAQTASNLIERILREGRAFGLHILLASQTTAGMQGLDKHVLSLIPTRIAMRTGGADSEAILGEGNSAAKDINRPGEGIINTKQGNPDANLRFQTTFWDTKDTQTELSDQTAVLRALRHKADHMGLTGTPRVFDGNERAALIPDQMAESRLPIGLPVSLDGPMSHSLRRDGGENLLVVDEETGPMIAAVVAAARAGIRVRLLDFLTNDEGWSELRAVLEAHPAVSIASRRQIDKELSDLAGTVADRIEFEDYNNPAELLVLGGLHRARDLDPDSYDDEGPTASLNRIVRDGPEVGIHTLAWADRAGIVGRRLSHNALREFGLRLVGPCSMDDSQSLLDSDAGKTLKPNQAIFDNHERGTQTRVLAYGTPAPGQLQAWLAV